MKAESVAESTRALSHLPQSVGRSAAALVGIGRDPRIDRRELICRGRGTGHLRGRKADEVVFDVTLEFEARQHFLIRHFVVTAGVIKRRAAYQ